jgi:hypothetical protein
LRHTAEALRAFEKGGPTPVAASDLLPELADGLAASGPMELSIGTLKYVSTLERLERALGHLQDRSRSPESVAREVRKALRVAQKLMLKAARSRPARYKSRRVRWMTRALTVLFVAGFVDLAAAQPQDGPARGALAFGYMITLFVWGVLENSWTSSAKAADVAAAAEIVAPWERPLLGARQVGARPFVIATDCRLLTTQREDARDSVQYSAPYADIVEVRSRLTSSNDQTISRVTVRTAQGEAEFDLEPDDAAALRAIVKHRSTADVHAELPAPSIREKLTALRHRER